MSAAPHGLEPQASNSSTTPLTIVIRADLEALSMLLLELSYRLGGEGPSQYPERIILYIHDLDRCAAATINEYLQAIQQLLGFSLFIVVVAADPNRILATAQRYDDLLEPDASSPHEGDDGYSAYLAAMFSMHLWIAPVMENTALADRITMGILDELGVEPESPYLTEVARVITLPQQAHRFDNLLHLAKRLLVADPDDRAQIPPGLLIQLAILATMPTKTRRYLDWLVDADPQQPLDVFFHHLGQERIIPRDAADMLAMASVAITPPPTVLDAQQWEPFVRRLAL
jgi:hypothetical protein